MLGAFLGDHERWGDGVVLIVEEGGGSTYDINTIHTSTVIHPLLFFCLLMMVVYET